MEDIISLQNPWKRGQPALAGKILPRKILPLIEAWLDEPEIIVIKGARQTGKTTIQYHLIDQLLQRGVKPENVFYFLLDNLTLQQRFSEHPYVLKQPIEKFLGQPLEKHGQRIYLFLDEIQKLRQFSTQVKEYFDLFPNMKFILSGSSILQASASISESLRGRTISFTVTPFSLGEVMPHIPACTFANLLDWENIQQHHSATLPYKSEILLYLNQQLVFGSMPRIHLSQTDSQRQMRLAEYIDTFMRKDIIETLRVAKFLDFEKLLRLLSFQVGNVVNISELATRTQLSTETIRKYLTLGEEAFIFQFVAPFFSNKRKSLVKDRKIYFEDLGIRNHLAGQDSLNLLNHPDLGGEAENFVHITLGKYGENNKHRFREYFFKSYRGQEVDFIIEMNGDLIPIEVKYQNQLRRRDYDHLLMFMEDFDLNKGLLVTKDLFDRRMFDDRGVILVPLWLFATIV